MEVLGRLAIDWFSVGMLSAFCIVAIIDEMYKEAIVLAVFCLINVLVGIARYAVVIDLIVAEATK